MRKVLFILLAIFLFLNDCLIAKADTKRYDGYIYFCDYEFEPINEYLTPKIYLQTRNYKKSNVTLYGDFEGMGGGVLDTIDMDFQTDDNIYIQAEVKEAFYNSGTCPKYIYVDNNFGTQVCFDNDREYCETQNSFAKIKRSFSDKKGWGTLKTSFKDEVKDFFNNFILDKSILYDTTTTAGEFALTQFQQKLLGGANLEDYSNDTYNIIKNMEEYNAGFESVQQQLAELQEQENERIQKEKEEKEKELKETLEKGEISTTEYEKELGEVKTETEAKEAELAAAVEKNLISIDNIKEMILNFTLQFAGSLVCSSYLGDGTKGTPLYYMKFAYDFIKYAGLVVLFVLSLIDFIKAAASSNSDEMKKTTQRTVKRIAIVVVLFILPTIINFGFKIFGITSNNPTCGIS